MEALQTQGLTWTPPKPPKRCWPKAGHRGVTADVMVEGLKTNPMGDMSWEAADPHHLPLPSPGKGGPSSLECLRGRLRCHFLSQDDVNNVTFLQHLSVRTSVSIKSGEG